MDENKIKQFDDVDLALLERIEGDFDVSLETLADELSLSKSAVHYRINHLKEDGVITGVTADIDPKPLGLDMVAITEIFVTHEQGYSKDIGEQLRDIDGVEQVYYTMGDVDFMTITRVQNREQMNETIESMVAIDGVNETSSRFVMNEIESNPRVFTGLSDDVRRILTDRDE